MSKRKRSLFVFPRLLFDFADEAGLLPKLEVALTLSHDGQNFGPPAEFAQRRVRVELQNDRLSRYQPYFQPGGDSSRRLTIWRQYYNISERLAILSTSVISTKREAKDDEPYYLVFQHDGTVALLLCLTESNGAWTLRMHLQESLVQTLNTHLMATIQKCNTRVGRMLYTMYEYEGVNDEAPVDTSHSLPPSKRQRLHILPTQLEEEQNMCVALTGPEPAVRQLFSRFYKSDVDRHMASHCTGNNSYLMTFMKAESGKTKSCTALAPSVPTADSVALLLLAAETL